MISISRTSMRIFSFLKNFSLAFLIILWAASSDWHVYLPAIKFLRIRIRVVGNILKIMQCMQVFASKEHVNIVQTRIQNQNNTSTSSPIFSGLSNRLASFE